MEQVLLGLIMPPIVDVVTKDIREDRPRFIIALAICLIAGIAASYKQVVSGSPLDILTSIALVFTTSQVLFNMYWKGSFVRGKYFSGQAKAEGPSNPTQTDQSVNNPLAMFGVQSPVTNPESEQPASANV